MLRQVWICTLCLLLASVAAWSQQYRVCDVSSAPASVKMSGGRDVARNIILEGKEMLSFHKFSKISLMEVKSKEMFFFSGEGELSVADVVSRNRTRLKANLKSHLKDLLQGKTHTRMAGVVYKDFASPVNYLDSGSLKIANADGEIVDAGGLDENGIYYFVVSNASDDPYFVNVIRTDASGNNTACCISNDAMAQMDLMVPVNSTVMLTSFPQLGKNLKNCTFRAAASQAPFDAGEFLENNPYIRLLSPAHNSVVSYPDITIRFLVKDRKLAKTVEVSVNGKKSGGDITVADGINEFSVKLPDYGENQIEINVMDVSGNSYSRKISVIHERVNKPRLHIMSVGIGNYKNSRIEKLHYAASDAAMVAGVLDTLREMNLQLYDKGGYRMLLTDEDATRGRILKCLDDIRYEADPEDIVMLYMSGHGKYVEFTSQRYFLPYDAEDDLYIESTAISYADLKGKLRQLEDKECKVIVYMDACYAGEMYFTKGANDFIGDSEPAVIGFYSSTRNQPSLEKVELNHGVFTYALLNGIKGGACDSAGNITISSLGDYITEQVRIESQGRQTPKVDNGGEDFILFKACGREINIVPSAITGSMKGAVEKPGERHEKDPAVRLAESYYTGAAVAATTEDEFKAYLAAANIGEINSMYMTGVCLETGKGCSKDLQKALEWYGKAARGGLAAAQYNLGTMYYNGNGTAKSVELAEKWFREADIKGYTKAAAALGHLYYHKAEPEYRKAFEYFSRAAEGGDAMALFYLGECHLYGNGTDEDISAALEAYRKSAEKGYGAAKEKLLETDY